MNQHLDPIDQELVALRIKAREKITKPLVGDFVLFPTGELERISHDWDDVMQTAPSGSIHLYRSGYGSFSGGLNPPIPVESLEQLAVSLPGEFWLFHHDRSGAGRAVYFDIPCRVFKTTAPYQGYLGKDFQSKKTEALKEELAHQLGVVQGVS